MKIILTTPQSSAASTTALFVPDDAATTIRLCDGQEILHIYLDEPIPSELSLFFDQDSRQDAELTATSGHIALGSRQQHTAADIPPGRYQVTLYATDFPDELIESTAREQLGDMPKPAPRLPTWVIWGSAALFVSSWFLGLHLLALISFFVPFLGWRLIRSGKTHQAKERASKDWHTAHTQLQQQRFPDSVVQLEHINPVATS